MSKERERIVHVQLSTKIYNPKRDALELLKSGAGHISSSSIPRSGPVWAPHALLLTGTVNVVEMVLVMNVFPPCPGADVAVTVAVDKDKVYVVSVVFGSTDVVSAGVVVVVAIVGRVVVVSGKSLFGMHCYSCQNTHSYPCRSEAYGPEIWVIRDASLSYAAVHGPRPSLTACSILDIYL